MTDSGIIGMAWLHHHFPVRRPRAFGEGESFEGKKNYGIATLVSSGRRENCIFFVIAINLFGTLIMIIIITSFIYLSLLNFLWHLQVS